MKARDILQKIWDTLKEILELLKAKFGQNPVPTPPVEPPVPPVVPPTTPPVTPPPEPKPPVTPGPFHPLPPSNPVPNPGNPGSGFVSKGHGLDSRSFSPREKAWIRLASEQAIGLPDFRRELFDGTYDDVSRLINAGHEEAEALSEFYQLQVQDWRNDDKISIRLRTVVRLWFQDHGRKL